MPATIEFRPPPLPEGCMSVIGGLQKVSDVMQGRGSIEEVKGGKVRRLNAIAGESLVNYSAPDLVENVLLPIVEKDSGLSSEVEQKRVTALAGAWLGEDRQRQRGQELLTALAYFPSEVAEVPLNASPESASSWRNYYLGNMIGWLFTERYLIEFLRNSRDRLLLPSDEGKESQAVARITNAVWSRVNDERRDGKAILKNAEERGAVRDIFLPYLASAHVVQDAKRYMAYVVLDQTPQERDSEISDVFFWHALGGFGLGEEDRKRVEARFSSGVSDDFLLKRIGLASLSKEGGQDRQLLRLGTIIASRGDMKFFLPLAYRLVPGVEIDPTVGRGICIALNGILSHEANRERRNMAVGINQAMELAVAAMELCVRAEGQEPGVWRDQQEMVRLLRTLHEMYPVVMFEGRRVWRLMEYFLRSAHPEDLEEELAYFREIIFRDFSVPILEPEQLDSSDAYQDIVALSFQLDELQLEEAARERILQLIAAADGGLATDELTERDIEMWRFLINRIVAPSSRVEFLVPLARRLHEFSGQADQLTSTGVYNAGLVCNAIDTIAEGRPIESRQVMSDEDTVNLISDVLLVYEKRGISTVETTVRMLNLIHILLSTHPEVAGNAEFCGKLLQAFPKVPDTAYGTDGFSEANLIDSIHRTIELYSDQNRSKETRGTRPGGGLDIE